MNNAQTITELKTTLDDHLTAMAIADALTVSKDPEHKAQAELDLSEAAERANESIAAIIKSTPSNDVEKAIRKSIWSDCREDIVGASAGNVLCDLQERIAA